MQPPEFYVVAFHNQDIPADFNFKNGDEVVRRIAKEKFGLKDTDFNPAATGHFGGSDGKGYVLTVELRAYAAHQLQQQNHPDVMSVFEPFPTPPHSFGARDPEELKKIRKNNSIPKP